jgi:hypothetical protein
LNKELYVLDAKVKSVLMFTPTKFTEWLIQQGLVRSEQYCTTHVMPDNTTPIKLKLGMYSDVSKFPYSGGYVWISECCPQRFVSVSVLPLLQLIVMMLCNFYDSDPWASWQPRGRFSCA